MKNNTNIRCIITDDEPMARKGLAEYVGKLDFMTLVATCEDSLQLNSMLETEKVDLLLLDIEMPYLSGLDLLSSLKNPPMVIITTAYEKYALRGYELDVVDYLLKPISFDRFLRSINKVRDRIINEKGPREQGHIFVKADGVFRRVNLDDILFVEALENYVSIRMSNERVVTHVTMKNMLASLGEGFLQTHKSYIVNQNRIDLIEGNLIGIDNYRIPIARNFREGVMARILMNRL